MVFMLSPGPSFSRSKLKTTFAPNGRLDGKRSPGVKVGDVDISVRSGLSLAPKQKPFFGRLV